MVDVGLLPRPAKMLEAVRPPALGNHMQLGEWVECDKSEHFRGRMCIARQSQGSCSIEPDVVLKSSYSCYKRENEEAASAVKIEIEIEGVSKPQRFHHIKVRDVQSLAFAASCSYIYSNIFLPTKMFHLSGRISYSAKIGPALDQVCLARQPIAVCAVIHGFVTVTN